MDPAESARQQQMRDWLRACPDTMDALRAARAAALPDWLLVAGAVYGAVFNGVTARPPGHGIKDFDIAFFDPDLSWDAEDAWIRKLDALAPAHVRPRLEARNQARVHLWFEGRFGAPYAPLSCSAQALERYLFVSDAVGARLEPDDSLTLVAPFGTADTFAMVLRANPLRGAARDRSGKAASMQARWPQLRIEGDDHAPMAG